MENIGLIGSGKNDLAISDGEGEIGLGLREDLDSGFAGEIRR